MSNDNEGDRNMHAVIVGGHNNVMGGSATIARGASNPTTFRQRLRLAWRMLRRGF